MMMGTIEEAWYYISWSLAPLLWINLLALSLSYWRDKDTDSCSRQPWKVRGIPMLPMLQCKERINEVRQYQRLECTFKLPSPSLPTRIVSRTSS
jgi:hypothetical protein